MLMHPNLILNKYNLYIVRGNYLDFFIKGDNQYFLQRTMSYSPCTGL